MLLNHSDPYSNKTANQRLIMTSGYDLNNQKKVWCEHTVKNNKNTAKKVLNGKAI